MRKIIQTSSKNFILSSKYNKQSAFSIIKSSTIFSLNPLNKLTSANQYFFSSGSQQVVQNQLIVPFKGYLSVRNSQNMQLAFQTAKQLITVLVGKNSTVQDVCQQIKQKLQAKTVYFVCNQGKNISDLTPFEALLDRNFFLILNDDFSVKVQGQLLRPVKDNELIEDFQSMQLPLTIRKDISSYLKRVNTWVQAKYGAGFQNTSIKIPKNQAKKIIIQALLDPSQSTDRITKKQQQFYKVYWQVQQLLDKKNIAAVQCSKMVRNRMSLGLLAILGNVGFIWSGTYIYFSWDIIEPIAYFVSSMAGILLCSRFFKIKKPFSLPSYKQYMINKYMPKALQNVGLNIQELKIKQRQLVQLESELKDYYLKKL